VICLINFSILPPHQSQEAPARQSAALPHTAAPQYLPIAPHSSPTYTSISRTFPAAGAKYHRPHPQQSADHSPLSRTPPPHQPAGHTGLPLTCPPSDQVESINSWISGICKDYPGIIPRGAMHPEHRDPEVEILWMRQPGIKGIELHGQRSRISLRSNARDLT